MKNFFPAAVLFMAFSALQLNAQTQTPYVSDLSDSSRALQFQISNDFTLISFQGTAISYMHHFTQKSALRIGLSISFRTNNSDYASNGINMDIDTLLQRHLSNSDERTNSFQLNTQYIWYLNPGAKLLLYGGTGPFLGYGYSSNHDKETYDSNPIQYIPSVTSTEGKARNWSAGILGTLGVEWFAAKGISLMAEYGLKAGYSWNKNEIKSVGRLTITKEERNAHGWNLDASSVKLGLSLYFQ
ncbi:MAG: hypothetical protein HF314_07240 [Ignavibacteria bacterium]|jgi:hypothetical protein|nr:hypothetical protein [Ignavibacteria bacterium]MCU7502849.1 hypothetical protein [Ignavibacteria bacterium]MCU7515657.1 hypothetical protein [Ignavibacteria bacterium]